MSAMVEIRSVRKSFGSHEVLRGIDLEVRTGEVTVVLGPSGSGKSTLLRTVNHLEKVDSGRITVDGRLVGYRRSGDKLYELREREVLRRRTQIGFVFQNFHLFPHLTVLENITEAPISALKRPRAEAVAAAHALLERVGLAEKAGAYPGHLSGGAAAARRHRPARSPSNPSCSSSTSPPPPSTRNWSARSSTSSRTWPGRAPP
ncbi:amino acid ABC transporter [Streptomyces albidoflavus]|nr:amino acid ABC transporter [Streptomyces albidoflavus]